VTLDTDDSPAMKVEGVTKGERFSLVAGISQTVVRTIKVVCGKDEQTLAPNMALPVGNQYAIIVGSDGKLEASVSAR
jgi:hypothetical protein